MHTSPLRRAALVSVAVGATLLMLSSVAVPAARDDAAGSALPLLSLGLDVNVLASRFGQSIQSIQNMSSFGAAAWPVARHGIRSHREPSSRAGIRHRLQDGVLVDYLACVRAVAPYARVTSNFDDWRPPSGMRPNGGLHNGYDIGLDAGTPVPCGWVGRVTKITPWWGNEHGITVETNNIEVTYGHLVPCVEVGDELEVGDVVGHVAYNHVDIKMHCDFGYIDWGKVRPFEDPLLAELHRSTRGVVRREVMARVSIPVPRVSYASPPRRVALMRWVEQAAGVEPHLKKLPHE